MSDAQTLNSSRSDDNPCLSLLMERSSWFSNLDAKLSSSISRLVFPATTIMIFRKVS